MSEAIVGGYVTRANPPNYGDVLIFQGQSWRVDQVVGGEGGYYALDSGSLGLADYKNFTLDDLVGRAYYSHRSVAVAPPKALPNESA